MVETGLQRSEGRRVRLRSPRAAGLPSGRADARPRFASRSPLVRRPPGGPSTVVLDREARRTAAEIFTRRRDQLGADPSRPDRRGLPWILDQLDLEGRRGRRLRVATARVAGQVLRRRRDQSGPRPGRSPRIEGSAPGDQDDGGRQPTAPIGPKPPCPLTLADPAGGGARRLQDHHRPQPGPDLDVDQVLGPATHGPWRGRRSLGGGRHAPIAAAQPPATLDATATSWPRSKTRPPVAKVAPTGGSVAFSSRISAGEEADQDGRPNRAARPGGGTRALVGGKPSLSAGRRGLRRRPGRAG